MTITFTLLIRLQWIGLRVWAMHKTSFTSAAWSEKSREKIWTAITPEEWISFKKVSNARRGFKEDKTIMKFINKLVKNNTIQPKKGIPLKMFTAWWTPDTKFFVKTSHSFADWVFGPCAAIVSSLSLADQKPFVRRLINLRTKTILDFKFTNFIFLSFYSILIQNQFWFLFFYFQISQL